MVEYIFDLTEISVYVFPPVKPLYFGLIVRVGGEVDQFILGWSKSLAYQAFTDDAV